MNAKQSAFVEYYLQHWNASKAARLAGYSQKNSNVVGPRLLADVGIALAIKTRLSAMTMGAEEVLARLSEQARADMVDFLDAKGNVKILEAGAADGQPDLDATKVTGRGRLIKKYKRRERKLADMTIEVYTEIELHDAQSALTLMGKHHRLFADKFETWQDDLIRALRDGSIKPKDVINELGRDAASALLVAAGVSGDEGSEADPESGDEEEGADPA
jgi:hypothetical protein